MTPMKRVLGSRFGTATPWETSAARMRSRVLQPLLPRSDFDIEGTGDSRAEGLGDHPRRGELPAICGEISGAATQIAAARFTKSSQVRHQSFTDALAQGL